MASIHSVPNMAAGNMSLPQNLTPQHIQEVYQVGLLSAHSILFSFSRQELSPDYRFHHRFYSLYQRCPFTCLGIDGANDTQKFQQMQKQGVRPDDPEFLKAHYLLAAVQRQQVFQKQRQFMHQQHQQQQQQQQQQLQAQPRQQQLNGTNVEAGANGINGWRSPLIILSTCVVLVC
jgi:ATP-dependent helicase STH1/SNF2